MLCVFLLQVHAYLAGFRKYDWLWKKDKDLEYKRFVASNPAISDYEVNETLATSDVPSSGVRQRSSKMAKLQFIRRVRWLLENDDACLRS